MKYKLDYENKTTFFTYGTMIRDLKYIRLPM